MVTQHRKRLPISSLNQTTDPTRPDSRLLSLPTEVLCLILDHLKKVDLKNGRLTCKALAPIIDSTLFREVVVVPRYGSLDAFVRLAHHPTLSKHVQRVTMDNRWGSMQPQLSHSDRDIAKWQDWFFHDVIIGDSDVEVAYLSRAFRVLPALTSLRFRAIGTLRATRSTIEEMPSYYVRCLEQFGAVEETKIAWSGVFERNVGPIPAWLAVFSAGQCLQTVQADGLHLCSMFENSRRFDSIRTAFKSLQHLQLSFSRIGGRDSHTAVDGLSYILSELPALESLDLSSFGIPRDPMDPPRFNQYLRFGLVLQRSFHYPRLAQLRLRGFCAKESQIMSFMGANAAHLKDLRLASIILVRNFAEECESNCLEPPPCWIKFIHGLQANLKLEHMEFDEYLSNRRNQRWLIDEDNDAGPNSLKWRVENFVINGGECPLDQCAVDKIDEIIEEDGALPDGGDSSWYEYEPLYLSESESGLEVEDDEYDEDDSSDEYGEEEAW